MTPEQIGQALTQAGWRLDGGFPEYPIVGRHDDDDDDHASITAHSWVWEKDTHVFELRDARTRRVYWVHAVPTPWQAKLLLEGHGGESLEEEEEKKRRSWAPPTRWDSTVTLPPRVPVAPRWPAPIGSC